MPEYSRQHYVPQSYLKAWCDPETPSGQTPYVWRFEKEKRVGVRKSPEKIFYERDMYTICAPDGGRDLRMEHGLSSLESEFARVRETVLVERQPITDENRFVLCAFTAAMHARTVASRDHWSSQWQQVVDMGDRMQESLERNPEAVPPLHMPGRYEDGGFTHEDVRKLAKEPLQHMLWPMIDGESKGLYLLKLAVFEAEPGSAFITSDAPCVWFDPEAFKRPPMFQSPGLAYPTLEVTLPISPREALFFSHQDILGYRRLPSKIVHELNRRTRFRANQHFISHENRPNERWFSHDPNPPTG